MRVILGLLIWSLAEISAFVVVGGWIGLGGVLALVLGSGVLGVILLRRQGDALRGMRTGGREGLKAAGDAGLLGLAALLLLLPGLLTDVAGALLLLPPLRAWIIARIGARVVVAGAPYAESRSDVVEAVAVEVTPTPPRQPGSPSGWTKP